MQDILSQFKVNPAEQKLTEREIGAFLQGMVDMMAGKEIDQNYIQELDKRHGDLNKAANDQRYEMGKNYFASLEKENGVVKTESGLLYKKTVTNDTGTPVLYDDAVLNVDYVMSVYSEFADGKKVQADAGNGVDFHITGLIKGAREGLQLMKEGESATFYITPELGYGPYPASQVIGANSYLIFEVKLNKIVKVSDSDKDKPKEESKVDATEVKEQEAKANSSKPENK